VTKRWPSWDVSKVSDAFYEIYYTFTNDANQTYVVKTGINLTTGSVLVQESEDFGNSCPPNAVKPIEITERFAILKCDELYIFDRKSLLILATLKVPTASAS
jgi:hypothetical protein